MVRAQARTHWDRTVFRVKQGGIYREITWSELQTQVEEIALGLLDLGVEPGDRVAILSENRPEWAVADLAILTLGAATVPIYATLTGPEAERILRHSGARVLFVSDPEMMEKVIGCQESLKLKLILFDAPYRVSGPRIWWLGELKGLGRTAAPPARGEMSRRMDQLGPDAVASIIYTSGTTGEPKGVMLTHANFLSNCEAIHQIVPIGDSDSLLSFLPLSHVFERMAGYYFPLSVGATIAYAETLETVADNLLEIRPTVITGVPRFYEKIHERIQTAVRSAPASKRALFRWAVETGRKRAERIFQNRPVPPWLALQHRLADRLVLHKLRERMGGRLRFCVSGGAPLSKSLGEFFYAAGILILEGYGLTETSPVICVNRPDRFRFGTVGVPLPGVEVRIAEDGEILTRGPHVMKGYFENPEATAEAIDPDGWFHTGDIGRLDAEGFLAITDRKKDLIKTSGGKMVAPQSLEAQLKADSLIADCVVIGDRRKYLTALVVPKPEWAARPDAAALIWERVQRINQKLASFEQIKKITVLAEPFSQVGGELTPTLKVKRRVIAERYAAQIEAMYSEGG